MDKIRTSLQGDRTVDLEVDSTKYHTSFHEKGDDGKPMKKNSNMGWHGDDKRKIVVGVCLGASATLSFIWRLPGSQKNCTDTRVTVPLTHGDVYVMSEKTIGSDWKSSSLLRCLHAVDLSGRSLNILTKKTTRWDSKRKLKYCNIYITNIYISNTEYYNGKICNKRPSSIQYNYRDLFARPMSADTLSHARQRV